MTGGYALSALSAISALSALSALLDLVSKRVVMAHLIVEDVMILEMTDSTLIVTNPVDCAHCAHFSISNQDVIIVNKELILAKEIAKMELLNVISVVNKESKDVQISKTLIHFN